MRRKFVGPLAGDTRKASKVPGDDLRELTQPRIDYSGTEWPRGTLLRILHSGVDNVQGTSYTEASIIRTPAEES